MKSYVFTFAYYSFSFDQSHKIMFEKSVQVTLWTVSLLSLIILYIRGPTILHKYN